MNNDFEIIPEYKKVEVEFTYQILKNSTCGFIWQRLLDQSKIVIERIPPDTPIEFVVVFEDQQISYMLQNNNQLSWNIRCRAFQFLYECYRDKKREQSR